MAIYRSDQATVTFAAEGSPGAYPELATIASAVEIGDNNATRTVATTALTVGDTSIILNGTCEEDGLVGNSRFSIVVGGTTADHGPHEVRKVVDGYDTNTLTLDHPLAFAHSIGTPVKGLQYNDTTADTLTAHALTNPALTNHDLITWLPGVYEAVDVPDPEQAFEPYYILGGQNRNAYVMYPGQETLSGSIGGMVLLNATPLRFPLGKMVTRPNVTALFSPTLLVGTDATSDGAAKGAIVVHAVAASGGAIAAGTLICFGRDDPTNDTSLGGVIVSHTAFSDKPHSTYEVRRLMRASRSGTGTEHALHLESLSALFYIPAALTDSNEVPHYLLQ